MALVVEYLARYGCSVGTTPVTERLGDDAAASLVEMLRQLEDEQEERREVQKEHLFQLLEERFLRHVVESDQRTRNDLGREVSDVRTEVGAVRVDLGKEIAGVRKEITTQTRWILVVMGGAAVLIPIMQRIMATLIP